MDDSMSTPTDWLAFSSPAKINLFLHITGRRPDGYHTLQTIFQLLDYGDTLYFHPNHSNTVNLLTPLADVPDDQNLIIRAARLLADHVGAPPFGVDIRINKRLPMGGGLGGGSSNAATTLLALNALWKSGLSTRALADLGLRLGADVPVFVHGHTAWGEGVGEQLTPLVRPAQNGAAWFLVVKPNCEVSTASVFSHKRLTRDTPIRKIAPAVERLDASYRNDCQAVVSEIYEAVNQALTWLGQYAEAMLTGTGSCIFAEFTSQADAEQVLNKLPDQWTGFVAKGIDTSPLLSEVRSFTTCERQQM